MAYSVCMHSTLISMHILFEYGVNDVRLPVKKNYKTIIMQVGIHSRKTQRWMGWPLKFHMSEISPIVHGKHHQRDTTTLTHHHRQSYVCGVIITSSTAIHLDVTVSTWDINSLLSDVINSIITIINIIYHVLSRLTQHISYSRQISIIYLPNVIFDTTVPWGMGYAWSKLWSSD